MKVSKFMHENRTQPRNPNQDQKAERQNSGASGVPARIIYLYTALTLVLLALMIFAGYIAFDSGLIPIKK